MTAQLFVDESKRRGFVMVAVEYPSSHVASHRATISKQLRPGQRRIHFKTERESVRRHFIEVIAAQQPQAFVFSATSGYEPLARIECLKAISALAIRRNANRLVIERDETRDRDDRRTLTDAFRGHQNHLTWEIQQSSTEPLLWVADAIAWCWAHPQKQWRDSVQDLVADQYRV